MENSILKVVVYFNLFEYPVTVEEIKHFLDQPFHESEFNEALNRLMESESLFRFGSFFSLRKDPAIILKREEANRIAVEEIERAKKVASFLYSFPFIKGVAISGSLSKNCADENSDFDFFVITKAGRLWIARTLLFAWYKLNHYADSRKKVCLNYFIDETALEIQEKNFYTALEIVTLIPCCGPDTLADFFEANKWNRKYFPNHTAQKQVEAKPAKAAGKLIEKMLNNKAGDKIDNLVMKFFKKRWHKLFNENRYSETGFRFGSFLAGRHYCKHMPGFLQQRILNKFEDGLKETNSRLTEEVSSNDIKVNVFN